MVKDNEGGTTYFIGIDVGTQGARVAIVDEVGGLIAVNEVPFELSGHSREEQDPLIWWKAVLAGLKSVLARLCGHVSFQQIKAISVTSTSGTIIALDKDNLPLHPAIMYSDPRSAKQGRLCQQLAAEHHPGGYGGFNASSGLSKMVWFIETFPEKAKKLTRFVHATDFIIGKLSGNWSVSDETNVLKSGYDLQTHVWPPYLFAYLPLQAAWLAKVVRSGAVIGWLSASVALEIGLDPSGSVAVVAGMTDGCASQIASGAVRPGDWNTTIGTTMVIKGVTQKLVVDPEDRLYNHHHPEGFWMPGGASNTGADWITTQFSKNDLHYLENEAAQLLPTEKIVYPLLQQGERFPFVAPEARGFGLEAAAQQPEICFAAGMEGVAYLEKMAFKLISRLSGESIDKVYTAGGGSNSELWLKIRSSVLNLPVAKMENVSGAVGAAVLAASGTYYQGLREATAAMTHPERVFEPEPQWIGAYEIGYRRFVGSLSEKGYIDGSIFL